MNRRTWLGLCAGTLSSGCLGLTGPPKKQIAWIRLDNDRNEALAIEVFIVRNGKEVFRENYQLGTSPDRASVRVDDPVDEPGRYSLYFDIEDQVAHLHPSEVAAADVREPCIGVRYTLHEQETSGFEFEPAEEC
ncbi:hypothetical protein [Haloplanus halophilus]|uniref:hypothetical protein n=1 Tax=Haloplanus halophilus TaxID=2949993 RepID=UPI002040A8C4|nr:hypothetical protein [Haloplanus sp. GDY1]